jgi:hypothetical protein
VRRWGRRRVLRFGTGVEHLGGASVNVDGYRALGVTVRRQILLLCGDWKVRGDCGVSVGWGWTVIVANCKG